MAERRIDDLPIPHDIALERAVLAAAIVWHVAADLRRDGVTADLFHKPAHERIWQACERIIAAGGEVDFTTVRAQLAADRVLDDVGLGYLAKLSDGVPKPSTSSLQWQVAKLVELSARRAILAVDAQLREVVARDDDGLQDGTVDRLIGELEAARQRPVSAAAWLDADGQWAALDAEAKREESGAVLTGITRLDEAIGGVKPGEVLGLMGRPGLGKTVLLGHQARVTAFCEQPHVFFSLEMPAAQIVTRLVQAEYGLSRAQVLERQRHGVLDVASYGQRFRKFALVGQGGLSVQDMSSIVSRVQDRMCKTEPIRAVTIDHLGLIGGDRRMSTYDRVSTQVREIKELAKRHNVAVILAIQVNRDAGGGDGSKELHLGSARDSGVVEEAMDYLVGVRRFDRCESLSAIERERYRDMLFLKIIKSRHGTPGDEVTVQFDYTLDIQPVSIGVPESVSTQKVANFGGRR
jgi:replicative DNA helicase